ncbi:rhamnan synthesis F family protein [Bartonella sp. HY406]|uniref:rhamnan synthesis F family protein n=1 Tax=Bartonella sp. HY406 TaxID=2979331 RepID=UPI0021C906E9|nr:rhamnan synthesis F family protein [Bartonella sp. HY406]UXN05125.1 rhamnan synthesis F family protein [Bartonella sp. HY406]
MSDAIFQSFPVFVDILTPLSWISSFLHIHILLDGQKTKILLIKYKKPFKLKVLKNDIEFQVDTIFWIRSNYLKEFVNLGFGWKNYPLEPIETDDTILHALERLV